MSALCNTPAAVEGAYGCPRTKGHQGVCYWWLAWEVGYKNWQAIVYSGEPYERRRRARGRFSAPPDASDVHMLLLTLEPLRKREQARRTPHSAPQPTSRPVRLERLPGTGLAVVRG